MPHRRPTGGHATRRFQAMERANAKIAEARTEELRERLRACQRRGLFQLSSAGVSKTYWDCSKVLCESDGFRLVAEALGERVFEHIKPTDAVGGPVLGAVPLVSAVMSYAVAHGYDQYRGFHVRGRKVEGCLETGDRVVLVEDVITTGRTVVDAAMTIEAHGAEVVAVLALVRRRARKVPELRRWPVWSVVG